jgi:chaperonin GroEL
LAQAHRALAELGLPGDEGIGTQVVRRALAEPLRWIAHNAGFESDDVVQIVEDLPLGHGFNALTGEYGDMFDEGVIDPLKVTRAALESAASIAALLITTETAVVEQVMVNPGAIVAPGFGDLAEGMVRPSNIY